MADCIFCQIIQDKAPGSIVYQDKLAAAFLDIHPINFPLDRAKMDRIAANLCQALEQECTSAT